MTADRVDPPRILPLGDAAVLVELAAAVDLEANRRARALAAAIARETASAPGWGAPIPGAVGVLVPVDPLEPGVGAAARRLETLLASGAADVALPDGEAPTVEIPTRYGGADGPDLDAVAAMTGLSPDAVVERHAGTTYTTLFLGFVPGFGYLGPLPAELALPRRPEPRTHVPEGSVAIAGGQTAVYPLESPGGWWLIGRTSIRPWDPRRSPPALLAPGTRVRFVAEGAVRGGARSRVPAASAAGGVGPAPTAPTAPPEVGAPRQVVEDQAALDGFAVVEGFEVVEPGLLTTVQDAGRPGLGALGVPRSGACDPDALAVANLLVGNRPDAAALEATIAGPTLAARRGTVVAITGADLLARVEPGGRRLLPGTAARLSAGERLAMSGAASADAGCRAYIAVRGGLAVPDVLGSRSTSLVGGFGGLDGRAIRAGDRLAVRVAPDAPWTGTAQVHRSWPADLPLPRPADPVLVLPGPVAATAAGREALAVLVTATWRVAPASDRRGLRLEGPELRLDAAATAPSHGVPTGTIQLTPSGQPIVLLPDAGPTGGYPVLAVVATASLGAIGQVRPGGIVRFRLGDLETARAAERERRDRLAAGAARLATSDPWDDLPDHAGA